MRNEVTKTIRQLNDKISQQNKQIIQYQSIALSGSNKKIPKSMLESQIRTLNKNIQQEEKNMQRTLLAASINESKNKPEQSKLEKQREIANKKIRQEKQAQFTRKRSVQMNKFIEQEILRQKVQQKQIKQQHQNLYKYLQIMKTIRNLQKQKADYIQVQHQKDILTMTTLRKKIEEKDMKIQQLVENIAILKKQLKDARDQIDEQKTTIQNINKQNSQYRAQNTEIKLKNKSLTADNKIVVTHLDKLLQAKAKNEQVNAQNFYQQREKRVIQALYSKNVKQYQSYSASNQKQILPSLRNQLSNKIKYENLMEQYKKMKLEKDNQIKILQEQLFYKKNQITQQKSKICKLQEQIQNLTELKDNHKRNYEISQQTISQMEDRVGILEQQNNYLRAEDNYLRQSYKTPVKPIKLKTKVGSIVTSYSVNNPELTNKKSYNKFDLSS